MESVNTSQQTQQIEPINDSVNLNDEHEMDNMGNITAITPIEESIEEREQRERRRSKRRRLLPKVIVGVLLGAGVAASSVYYYRWTQFNRFHLTTDVAYTSADIYPVTSRVGGIVTEVSVKQNQAVGAGTTLVKLDPREYQVGLAQARAALDVAKQQAEVARENINNVPPTIIPEPLNSAPTSPNQPKLVLPKPAETFNRQVEVNRQQYKAALATVTQRQAEVKQAELKLSYATVSALVPGAIGNTNIRVGQQVQPGQTLVEIVQPNRWVVANFKENQLERIQPGQKAEIKIAAFPSRKFKGTVESVSSTPTTVVASPSPDSTNNSLGNIQSNNPRRIPVKVVFEPDSIKGFESRIAPGMSADVIISTRK
ncbi:MAG: HlyD family secretion protein [Calothrix sp. FI2-JRJ7]|jgi:membrane fusion protein (multidrug efflux system)|nr:HlyD family secretion protein [Calothrix sp. FI2-JRJ7]